jgi:exonuclease III
MILLSLNIRGVGGTLKSASLRRLLRRTRPDIIFLQETMVEEHKARALMLTLRPTWLTCAVSVVGTSGGLLVSWDPNIFDIDPFLCCGGILLSGMCLELNQPVSLLNVYGPCSERKDFWEKLAANGILDRRNLILAGDLNLTCGAGEMWGATAHLDPLSTFFTELFSKARFNRCCFGCFGANLEEWS